MKILWVKVGGLWPANTGGRLRSFNIISQLSREHKVTVMTTHREESEVLGLKEALSDCEDIVSIAHAAPKRSSLGFVCCLLRSWLSLMPVDVYRFRIAALSRQVSEALRSGEYDVCVADFLVAVPNIDFHSGVPVVLFEHNVEYMIWKRLAENSRNPLQRLVLEVEWRKMRYYESRACKKADLVVAVSDVDADMLELEAPGAQVTAIPTGVDTEYFSPDREADVLPREIVFSGSMDWQPNDDAMKYFINYILPLIREEEPTITLTIVGRNPGEKLRELADRQGVKVTGTVDDIRPFVKQAAVYIVPLRVGGGTRLKIYEALAMGKAVVSTTIGAEGLPLEEGVHILREDDPERFALAVVELLRDPARQASMGEKGRCLMERRYSWSSVSLDFEICCSSVSKPYCGDAVNS